MGVGGQGPGARELVVLGGEPDGLLGERGRVFLGLDRGERDGAGGEQRTTGGRRRVVRQPGELLGQQLGRALGVAARAQGLGGVDREPGPVDQRLAGLAETGEQPQRPLEVLGRLVGTTDLGGLVTGLHAGLEGGLVVVGELGVAGQLGGGAAGPSVADGGGVAAMEPHSLAGQQVVVDGLAEQGVTEGVVAVAGDQDVALDGGAQALVERRVVEVGRDGEQLVGDPASGDARRPNHLARGLVEPVEPDQQHLGEVGGQAAVVGTVVAAGGGADELLDEERVALGTLDDHVDLVVGQDRPGPDAEAGDQLADLGGVERLEGHAVHGLEPRPVGHLGAQRVLAVEVVGPVGRHERHRLAERSGEQEAHQVSGRLVGPVEVLDDDHERLLLGGGLEEGVHGFEQRGLVDGGAALAGLVDHPAAGREALEGGVMGGDGGDDLGGGGLEAAEDLGEGEVGQGAVGEVEAVAGDDLPAEVEGAVAQRGEEAGLADAGVAGQKDRDIGAAARAGAAGVAGRDDAEPESEVLQLGISSHERRRRHRHAPHHVGCRGHSAA